MFAVSCSYIHLLDVVASRCRVPFYSYLREIMDDGDVLGGVELDVSVPGSDSLTIRRFFWAQDRVNSLLAYEGAAFQAIRYLQHLYGFATRNTQGMGSWNNYSTESICVHELDSLLVHKIYCSSTLLFWVAYAIVYLLFASGNTQGTGHSRFL